MNSLFTTHQPTDEPAKARSNTEQNGEQQKTNTEDVDEEGLAHSPMYGNIQGRKHLLKTGIFKDLMSQVLVYKDYYRF